MVAASAQNATCAAARAALDSDVYNPEIASAFEACVSEQVASNTYDSEINLGLGESLSPVCGEVEEPPPPLPIELQAMRMVLLQRIPVRDGQQSNPASNCAASEAE
jgi:hypothetical protein